MGGPGRPPFPARYLQKQLTYPSWIAYPWQALGLALADIMTASTMFARVCSPPHPNPHPDPFSLLIFRRWRFRVWFAEKRIARDDARARIHLDGVTGEFPVARIDFPNGGWWAFVLCHCGQRCRRLWVHDDHLCWRSALLTAARAPVSVQERPWTADRAVAGVSFLPFAGQATSAGPPGSGSSVAVGGVVAAGGVY